MWQDKYLKEAKSDLDKLDTDLREMVLAGIKKSGKILYRKVKVVTASRLEIGVGTT